MSIKINLTGTQIGNYKFGPLLGGGGFAEVYLCDELFAGGHERVRQVAVKVFYAYQENRADLQKAYTNFKKDLEFLAKSYQDSPIVRYFNAAIEDVAELKTGKVVTLTNMPVAGENEPPPKIVSVFLIAMEYADGGTLENNYRTDVLLNPDKDHLSHFKDVCIALHAAHSHERHIIHRDVKPANIFWFRKANQVKLGDFGVAKSLDEDSMSLPYLTGTLPYIAPEIFSGDAYSPASDVYALGCTFYELYTGKRAFDPSTMPEIAESGIVEQFKHIHQKADRPDTIRDADISVSLSGIIKKMMAIKPEDRPSLPSVIEELERERHNRTVQHTIFAPSISVDIGPDKGPMLRSSHIVSPLFRRAVLGEFAYFMLIDMQPKTDEATDKLFSYLEAYFGATYSTWEVFGDHAFFVRVWSPSESRVEAFVNAVKQHVFRDHGNSSLRIMPCEDIRYLHCRNSTINQTRLDKTEALLKLDESQRWNNEKAKKWLEREKIYLAKHKQKRRIQSIKCFCFLRSLSHVDEGERAVQSSVLRTAIMESEPLDAAKLDISIYRRAYAPMGKLDNIRSDHLISYLAPKFSMARTVPDLIVREVSRTHRFKTITILTTGCYVVESHNVNCD